MDTSREQDLIELARLFNDPNKPLDVRTTAYRNHQKILVQMRDRKLTDMRHQLIKAVRLEHEDVPKLQERIRQYSVRKGYTQP